MTEQPLSFESAYARLEEILEKMNSGKSIARRLAQALRRSRPPHQLVQQTPH